MSAQLNLDGADDVLTVSVENGLLVHDPIGDGLKTSADWDSATPGEQTVPASTNAVIVINGGDGNDTLSVSASVGPLATVTLNGGAGNDLTVVNGDPTLGDAFTLGPDQLAGFVRFRRTNLATFSLLSDTERFQVFGLGGDDSFSPAPGLGSGTGLTISGGDGADTIVGSDGPDRILGGNGNDTIVAGSGSDVVSGDAGDDQIDLRDGAPDVAHGGEGFDSALTDGASVDSVDGFEAVDVPPPPAVTPPPATPPPATVQPPAVMPPPAAPPGPGPSATPLTIRGSVVDVRRGRVSIRVSCPATSAGDCVGLLTLRSAGRRLGSAHYDVAPGRTLLLRVRLATTTRRLAGHSRRVKVVATAATGPANQIARTSHRLTLAFRGR